MPCSDQLNPLKAALLPVQAVLVSLALVPAVFLSQLHPSHPEYLFHAGTELWRGEGACLPGPCPTGALALPAHLPSHCLLVPAGLVGSWGTKGFDVLLCLAHGFWAQRAGTGGAWARRQLQRCLWLTSQRGAALLVPAETGTVPSSWLLLGYVPNEAYGEQQGQWRHCPGRSGHMLHKRAGAAPGMGRASGGQGDPGGGPRGRTTTKPSAPASLKPSKKLV